MKIHKVRVDGQTFVLRPDADLKSLQDEILVAARQGAGFVRFETVGRATVVVLITPQVGVRFETTDAVPEQIDEWEKNPPPIDADPLGDFADVL
jgi:NAD(P)H-hydrate repair Nnr-like enzyme with NAD(P)H-hydrate dehydratase domain